MIVWVDDALFTGAYRDLDRLALLRNASRRRHTLVVSTNPGDPWGQRPAPAFDAWLSGLSAGLRTEIEMNLERLGMVPVTAVIRGAQRVLVCDRDPGTRHMGCRLSLEDAVRALSLPLHVLVEHQIHDAAFLRRVLPPAWRARFAEWEGRGELRYENGGGLSVMSALVDFHCRDDNARLAFGLPAEIWRLLHFIVFDHDGDCSNSPSRDSSTLGRTCDQTGMGGLWHRLERRKQEHYLPVPALRRIVEKRLRNGTDRERLLEAIATHAAKDDRRHFEPLPSLGNNDYFKNEFKNSDLDWSDEEFEEDGAWPEMTRLAERIASSM